MISNISAVTILFSISLSTYHLRYKSGCIPTCAQRTHTITGDSLNVLNTEVQRGVGLQPPGDLPLQAFVQAWEAIVNALETVVVLRFEDFNLCVVLSSSSDSTYAENRCCTVNGLIYYRATWCQLPHTGCLTTSQQRPACPVNHFWLSSRSVGRCPAHSWKNAAGWSRENAQRVIERRQSEKGYRHPPPLVLNQQSQAITCGVWNLSAKSPQRLVTP